LLCFSLLFFAFAAAHFLFASAFAGIRVGAFAAQALPGCGAAPTFLCRGKEK
jgi:hypothetical protein